MITAQTFLLRRCCCQGFIRPLSVISVLTFLVLAFWISGTYVNWQFVGTSVKYAFIYYTDPPPSWITPHSLGEARHLALQLVKLRRRLQHHVDVQQPLGLKDLMELQSVLMLLDPSIEFQAAYRYDGILDPGRSLRTPLVCPETYVSPHAAVSWVLLNCTMNTSVDKLLTVIVSLPTSSPTSEAVDRLAEDFRKAYPGIRVAFVTDQPSEHNVTSFTGRVIVKSWREAVDEVKTPYVLMAPLLFRFSKDSSSLERLLRVLTEVPGVAAVGGALRNLTGHWHIGCFQTRLENYVLEYRKGYSSSQNESMLCDYIGGPFVTSTSLLQNNVLDERLDTSVLFQDFFLNLSLSDRWTIMLCPDVMFHANGHMVDVEGHISSRQLWLAFARKWELNRVLIYSKFSHVLHRFSCEELRISCKIKIHSTSSYTIPVCCQEELGYALKFWDDFCRDYHLEYQLSFGSVLGAVKMADFIPWDIDVDGGYHEANYSFLKSMAPYFLVNGFNLTEFRDPKCCAPSNPNGLRGSYFQMWSPSMKIEMWAHWEYPRDEFLWPDKNDAEVETKIELHGVWVKGPPNPGLYTRNRYGHECLKHAQSWSQTGKKDSMQPYEAGRFKKCRQPLHQSCLDRFPVDGNIAYMVQ